MPLIGGIKMILFNKAFLKVWIVDRKDKYTGITASTGDKQQDGTYKNSSWNCRLIGKAHDLNVAEGDRIEVLSGKVENIYNKEQGKSWLNVIIFDAAKQGGADAGNAPIEIDDSSELPF